MALFDFDGTLTRRDTLLPFLKHCVGTATFLRTLGAQTPGLLGLMTGLTPNDEVKQRVLAAFLGGWPAAEVKALGAAFAGERLPGLMRKSMLAILQWHLEQGHRCFLVSASLDVYLQPWSESYAFSGVLCSRLEVSPEGLITGRLQGSNVYGPEKRKRVQEALPGEPSGVEFAYGDSRGDREMLSLARYAWYQGRFMGAEPPGWMD